MSFGRESGHFFGKADVIFKKILPCFVKTAKKQEITGGGRRQRSEKKDNLLHKIFISYRQNNHKIL